MANVPTRALLALACAAALAGCSQVPVQPIPDADHAQRVKADRVAAQHEVPPLGQELRLDEAIARALKYNLDRRARQLEEALALQQWDASGYDALPKLVAAAGYSARDRDRVSRSTDAATGVQSLTPSISQSREHTLVSLDLSWSLLDFGLAHYNQQQAADRVLAAAERRRKATHLLVQDVRVAYWRAASAQRLQGEVKQAIALANEAMDDARKAEEEKLRSPLDSLRYQRQLTENMRLLESIESELATARFELAALINVPAIQQVKYSTDPSLGSLDLLSTSAEAMEEQALAQNADLREHAYQRRIAATEARKVLVRHFPNLSLNLGARYDTDRYLVEKNWAEAGIQTSFNFINLLALPAQQRAAEAGIALADQRRLAAHVAVVTQVHVAREQLGAARKQLERANALWVLDDKIMQQMLRREQAQAGPKLERVASQTTMIISLLRRYQALAQVHAATSRLQATLGVDPLPESSDDLSLEQLRSHVASRLLGS
ncbi:MAG TPA: TolC family protein [Burkholderiaceae bacterium]|nr:TolC family protein [Burkholderiaceae bacterium]HNB46240.1 TolC family protein [Burkholderiaceae bacterium]HNG80360.1 TolC family protein [Burkholderiaceae bacterium]